MAPENEISVCVTINLFVQRAGKGENRCLRVQRFNEFLAERELLDGSAPTNSTAKINAEIVTILSLDRANVTRICKQFTNQDIFGITLDRHNDEITLAPLEEYPL